MTLLDTPPVEADEAAAPPPPSPVSLTPADSDGPRVRPDLVVAAAAFTSAGAAWMIGGLFRTPMLARGLSLLGVVIAAGIVFFSYRTNKSTTVQYLVLPAAMSAGAVVVAPAATGGTANLPSLVVEALTSGGLAHAPAPFDPGWRFLVIVVSALLTGAASINAVRRNRAKFAVALPAVVLLAASTLQPAGSELLAGAVGVLFVVAGLAMAYGAEISQDGDVSGRFEVRRLARGAAMGGALVVVMGLVSQLGFLFPDVNASDVIPPQRPPPPVGEKDRVLFEAATDKPGPWRLGVLDGYDGSAWLLPPFDPKRVGPLEDGRIPKPGPPPTGTYRVGFAMVDMRGHALPLPAGAVRFEGGAGAEYDPRTGSVRLPERIRGGYSYTVDAVEVPTGRQLNESPAPAEAMKEFLQAPTPPNEVVALLEQAPTSPFDRLQVLRDTLYSTVVAAGAGTPSEVPPQRVVEMLQPGAEATPFEITAAEALLARWAGVPSRIGFGYHRGEEVEPGRQSFRPRHGAAWLEVWFEGHGWVPLVGIPPRAKSSVNDDDKNFEANVLPSTELAMEVFLPARRVSFRQVYEVVRYWVLVLTPVVSSVVAAIVMFPFLMKRVRVRRRRHWAEERGPLGRILVAYASLRDDCHDLNIGDVRLTPVEFADRFTQDAEHDELAYLVTRSVWGDLRRDLRDDDAEACEEAVRSVRRRIMYEQPMANRILGALSKTSLRDPWSEQLPNAWPHLPLPGAGVRRRMRQARLRGRRAAAGAAAVVVLALLLPAWSPAGPAMAASDAAPTIPDRLVPDAVVGFTVQREVEAERAYHKKGRDLLVDDGRVFSFRRGERVGGLLQVAKFKDNVDGGERDLQADIERSIGGVFKTYWFGTTRVRMAETLERRTYLWFPADHNVVEILITEAAMAESLQLLRGVVGYQIGFEPGAVAGGIQLTPRGRGQ